MIIREYSENDTEEITLLMKHLCELKNQEFDEIRWRRSLENQMKQNSNSEVFVAIDDDADTVVGMAYCSVRTGEDGIRFGYISNLIVKEEKRRIGIGEELMKYIIEFFKGNHIKALRLALKPNSEKIAKLLFTKLGFQEKLRIYELVI